MHSESEVPEGRCGFELEPGDLSEDVADDYEAGSDEWHKDSDAVSCWREVWGGADDGRCIWHADTEDKPVEALIEARADRPERLDGAYVPAVKLDDAIDFEECRLQAATFDGTELQEASFAGVDGLTARFFDADLTDAEFPDADLPFAKFFHADLVGAQFPDADLHYAQFPDADLQDAQFPGADLQVAEFPGADLRSTQFHDAVLWKAWFPDANLTDAKFQNTDLGGAQFPDANLTDAQFREVYFRFARFHDANLEDAQFHDADLSCAQFHDATLYSTQFHDTDLDTAQFPDASLRRAQFPDANLPIVQFTDADLRRAQFPNANLGGAQFSDADLRDADLTDADATDATFTNTTIESGTLRGANLGDADLTDARLHDAHLQDVRINDGTKFGAVVPEEADADWFDGPLHAVGARLRWWRRLLGMDADDRSDRNDQLDRARTIYRNIQRLYRENSIPEEIDQYYIRAKETKRKRAIIEGNRWRWLYLAAQRWVMGYGERPLRVVATSLVVIGLGALLYPIPGIRPDGADQLLTYPPLVAEWPGSLVATARVLAESVYFSTVTFTTLGYGDVAPVGWGKALATVESFVGALLMALLVYVLGRRATR